MSSKALFPSLIEYLGSQNCVSRDLDDQSHANKKSSLVLADENISTGELALIAQIPNVTLLTNRYDLDLLAKSVGIQSYFSDFDFSQLGRRFDYCVFRIAKERALNHYIFNQLQNVLHDKSILILGGKKNEGIKNYYQKLTKECGLTGRIQKDKSHYHICLEMNATPYSLDEKNYTRLDKVVKGRTYLSKPGIYGWNKVDYGSVFLMDTLLNDQNIADSHFDKVIDLGCGYGFLSLEILHAVANKQLTLKRLYATDNNAAAVHAAKKNIEILSATLELSTCIEADDCGSRINEKFELLVCNPPFHQGFDNSPGLSKKFITHASRLLKTRALGYFVVNVFIPFEKMAQGSFSEIESIANNGQFKVIRVKR